MKVKGISSSEAIRGRWRVTLLAVLAGVLSASAVTTIELEPRRETLPDIRRDATVEVVERAMPSVVNIAIATLKERDDQYYQMLRQYYRNWPKEQKEVVSVGSGVIIDENGFLITNYHVVENATRIQVKLSSGEVYEARPFIGNVQRDIALLKIVTAEPRKFQAMKFARNDDLLLGETVIAIGNPYGLGGSVTRGILSSKNRRDTPEGQRLDIQDWLQTDADINPGNSGGPLMNLRGELIGMNVAVHREDQGMGVSFAIPVKQINAGLSEFFTPEVVSDVWLGIRATPMNAPLSISYLQPGSPAAKAGLRVGQQIYSVNGVTPRNLAEFPTLFGGREDGRMVLQVDENGQRRTVTVPTTTLNDLVKQRLGLEFDRITPEITARYGVRSGEGMYIKAVEPGSPADRMNLKTGFFITAMDDLKTGAFVVGAQLVSDKASGDRVKVSFYVPPSFGNRFGYYQTTLTLR